MSYGGAVGAAVAHRGADSEILGFIAESITALAGFDMAAISIVEDDELRSTFNGGIGMALVVPPTAVARLGDDLWKAGFPSWVIGHAAPVEELDGRRYVEVGPRA